MTKTLTEQWSEGTLPDGYYYVTSKKWGMLVDRYKDQINDCGNEWRGFDNCQGIVEEVIAPVLSYREFERLQGQLKDANEAIMSMVGNGPNTADEIGQAYLEKWGVK